MVIVTIMMVVVVLIMKMMMMMIVYSSCSLSKMERDHSQAISEHKTMVKQLNKKTDASMDGMKQQHTAAIAKVSSGLLQYHNWHNNMSISDYFGRQRG